MVSHNARIMKLSIHGPATLTVDVLSNITFQMVRFVLGSSQAIFVVKQVIIG